MKRPNSQAAILSFCFFLPFLSVAEEPLASTAQETLRLRATNEVLVAMNASLVSQVATLAGEIAQLKARISALTSTNLENAIALTTIASAMDSQQLFWVSQGIGADGKVHRVIELGRSAPKEPITAPATPASTNQTVAAQPNTTLPKNERNDEFLPGTPKRSASPTPRYRNPKSIKQSSTQ